MAASMAVIALLLLADKASSITALAKGIRASGKPIVCAALMAVIACWAAEGLARPISS